jgi:hypothetical protein
VFQWEPSANHSDWQWYLMGGPLASIDSDSRPGSGFGGQLGVGLSFRTREVPLLAEIVAQSVPTADPGMTRGGVQVGIVF